MGRSGIIVTGIVGIALVIAAVLVFGGEKNNSSDQNKAATPPAASENSTNSSNTAAQPETAADITYSGSTFSPSQITVNSGDTVTIKNDSSATIDIESAPHPIHTDNPQLNLGVIEAGASKSFTLSKTGSFGYHNHLNETQTGTIVVR